MENEGIDRIRRMAGLVSETGPKEVVRQSGFCYFPSHEFGSRPRPKNCQWVEYYSFQITPALEQSTTVLRVRTKPWHQRLDEPIESFR